MDQFHPIQRNATTGELFLPLLDHPSIILTPPRRTDRFAMVPIMNDERVYPWLISPPFPYTLENADWWLDRAIPATEALIAELSSVDTSTTLKTVNGCPVTQIRELLPDGSDVFIGAIDFTLARHPFELEGTGRTPAQIDAGPQRDPANPDVWTVGDYLAPSHHGRGIMSDAFRTLLTLWGIPRMGIRKMAVNALKGNGGSVRVFEKYGFRLREYKAGEEPVVNARGFMKPVDVLDWSLE
ncbi:N-acetyltransferase domain-containing protein [Mycena kentingensis (nom. inval.)]|nr:N-acetyltransferase domain-containing protein [Mycena kentingensis (nom. inval.)]